MMTQPSAAQQREEYLARLDTAMRGVPYGIAGEIRAGIAEELEGADAATTARRIAQLGDPEDIAREAQAAASATPVPVPYPTNPAKIPATRTRGFAIAAALILSFGGIVLPLIGWVVGVVMVSLSTLWRTWEKLVAILVPPLAAGLSIVLGLVPWTTTSTVTGTTLDGLGQVVDETVNPLVPGASAVIWSIVAVVGLVLIPASGLWLLWRMRDRRPG